LPTGTSRRAGRHVATLDVLFLLQTVLCLLTALALLITRHVLVVLAAAALMAGTMVGFVLARSVGIFGFKLTFPPGWPGPCSPSRPPGSSCCC
jgi:hypothetical protein